jgi:hypothetical protein
MDTKVIYLFESTTLYIQVMKKLLLLRFDFEKVFKCL